MCCGHGRHGAGAPAERHSRRTGRPVRAAPRPPGVRIACILYNARLRLAAGPRPPHGACIDTP
ncbi:hypothetical protein CBM2592_B80091 [Cupriavidus taiwanensis]|nr:hypothetical protein CBM2592_B80091 [Cupriavidus taiwanensis]SOY72926.1 hypothetical protein CBM2588_B80088 [Cupriavidus taiwanensis]SOY96894.1 hypothetical protein CBM2591_B60091 [Cupriavidus taiwanensis]SOZ66819.1 hypothetical protein CBM2617_B100090 [Cupriavidus taiwanensis]SOZ84040.1 hypothetical protein CBM2618_B100092 [Cupriavidus taiwanensis]